MLQISKIKFKNCVKEHCGVFKAGVKICTKICQKKPLFSVLIANI